MAPSPPRRAGISQLLRVGPPASASSVLNAYGFCLGALPPLPWGLRPRSTYRRSSSHVPCSRSRPGSRRLYAGHRLARTRDTRQAHPKGENRPLGFDVVFNFSTPQQRRSAGLPTRAIPERLPGPHMTRSNRAFSLPLTTTVFSQRNAGSFRICPRGPILEGRNFAPPSATQLRRKERRCYYTSPFPATT